MSVNGKLYSYENIQVALGGKMLTGATDVDYTQQGETTELHVLGSAQPAALIEGKRTTSGSITLTYNEYDALQDSIPTGKSLLDIAAFEIVITRLGHNDTLRTDVIKKVRFEQVAKSYRAGESVATLRLPFRATNIEFNK